MKGRIIAVVFVLVLLLSTLSVRLIDIQYVNARNFIQQAAKNHTLQMIVKARRGDILDASGNIMATSVPCRNIVADTIRMRQILADRRKLAAAGKKKFQQVSEDEVARELGRILAMNPKEIAAKMRESKGDVILAKRIGLDQWGTIMEAKLPGIKGEETYIRSYPEGRGAAHVLGYVSNEGVGMDGVERSMNSYLLGTDGFYVTEKDARQVEMRVYRSQDKQPKDGYNICLTIDQTIQHIVEEELDAAMQTYNPSGVYAIVMKPDTGEIMAMANRPSYDPNSRGQMDIKSMRNRCVADVVEPGSTFKIVTTAAALNEEVANLDTVFFCENGSWEYYRVPLHDHGSYGDLSVRQILQKSSNIGFAKIAIGVGEERLFSYIRAFGFGRRTMDGYLGGEAKGKLASVDRWSKISITRIPIGYEVGVTPIQVVSAMSVIANGGSYMRPIIVREVRDADGKEQFRYEPKELRQVIRPETAARVLEGLEGVVSKEGTAAAAKVPGFRVAGKTGTARKWDAEKKCYSRERYLASFIGFLPADKPKFVMLVMVDEPTGGKSFYGGKVAAPVFSAAAKRIANHLDLRPAPAAMEVAAR